MANIDTAMQDTGKSSHQYVTYQVGDEGFGFDMEEVLEIIRVPQTIPVPLTSDALVGLANLRGNVLPVLDLRSLLKQPKVEHGESTRVVVTDAGTPVGFVVDSISRVMEVADDCVEKVHQMSSTIAADLLAGVVKGAEGEALTQLLDVSHLVGQEFSEILAQARKNAQSSVASDTYGNQSLSDEEEDASQLVSFVVDDQEYALDLMDMEEIVRVPEEITKVPATEGHVLGMVNLRGRLLPLVSLRRMFRFDDMTIGESNRVLVVSLKTPSGGREQVGVVVDRVQEVLRVPTKVQDEVPTLFADGEENCEITSICRLDDGARLVSILSAERLFQNPAIQEAMAAQGNEEVTMNDEIQAVDDEGDTAQMVVFNLEDQEYGVMLDHIQEITRVPEEINRVPKTADFIEGMINLRGKVMPVMDMRTRLGLDAMERNDKQRILVLDVDGIHQGFITDAVVEVLQINGDQVETSPNLSTDQSRVMGEVVNLKASKRMIQLLEVKELLGEQEKQLVAEMADELA